jgi:RNA polymerase primary sigma factor
VLDLERKLVGVERELAAKLGREPDDEEIIAAAGVTEDELTQVRDAARAVTSLDKPVGDERDGGQTLGDIVARETEEGPEGEVIVNLREDAVRRAVARLPDEMRRVIELRFGLDGRPAASLAEAGRELGLSPKQVRDLEYTALEQLAVSREVDGLREAA